MSTPVYVCVVAVAGEAVVEAAVSLIAMAEAPRAVGGKIFTPVTVHLLYDGRWFSLMPFK